MRNIPALKITLILFITIVVASCNTKDPQKEAEAKEENKVGKIYNPEEQGIEQENRDNQFPSSRNDNKKGTGLETGAPSDTTKIKTTQDKQPAK